MKQEQIQIQEKSLKILETYPKQFYKELVVHEIKDVFDMNLPSMAVIKRESGVMTARAVMVMMITDVALFFNTGQNMNQDQVAETADLVFEDYWYLNVADFKLCFKNAKKGRYGKVFRIDGGVILEWIEKYVEQRINEAELISLMEHESTKGQKVLIGLEKLYEKFKKDAENS